MTFIAKISATGQYDLGTGSQDQQFVSGAVVTLYGFTGSLVLQKKAALGTNPPAGLAPNYFNVPYGTASGSTASAGTAITTDGMYVADCTGAVLSLNVTAVTGSFTVIVTPVEGAVGAGVASGSGGGGGGNAYVPTLRYGDTALTQLAPAGDTPAHGIFGNIQGQILDGATAAGTAPVILGGVDTTGNARSAPCNLSSATPLSTANYGVSVNATMFGLSSANTLRAVVTANGFTGGGNGANTLMVANAAASTATASAFEQMFNNLNVSILASAARTTTQTSADQTNFNHCGIHIWLNVTSAGTGSVTLALNGKDSVSGVYYPILTGAAVTTNSFTRYTIFPASTAAANSVVNDFLPRLFQIVVTANNANSVTYSVGYSLVKF